MRAVPDDFDPDVVAAIDARLASIVAGGVAIPLAVESGSRAWGFPSPDSDYDCRFLYVRSRDAYLSLWPPRDVIETPLDRLLDVNGWDIAKALRLAVRGNAVVVEWLRSPVVYRGDPTFRDLLTAFCVAHVPVARVRRHYLHLAIGQRAKATMAVKKLFYLLRPALALRWMRLHPDALPPMHFPTLLAESDVADSHAEQIADLIRRKATTRELGEAPPAPDLLAFADDEIAISIADVPPIGAVDAAARAAADATLRQVLDRWASVAR